MSYIKSLKWLALVLVLAAFSPLYAQEEIVISPMSIVVNPLPSYEIEVFVDKDPSGTASPSYVIGDPIKVSVRVSEDSYIYLFSIHSDGKIDQILPNRFDSNGQNNFVRVGETKSFPPNGARYTFSVGGPAGLDKVLAVASKTQLDTTTLASFESDPNFASSSMGEAQFAQSLSIVVTPIPQAEWVTDTTIFYVLQDRASQPTPIYGNINVMVNPARALVYIDDEFRGYAPLSLGELPGKHKLQIGLHGYATNEQEINVQAGVDVNINVELSPVP
ncbi:MAG: DUF4384 domain-containing protein [Deinococcales bacterium]